MAADWVTVDDVAASTLTEERFVGPGFGSRRMVVADGALPQPGPRVTSARGTMRRSLPGVYQDNDFAMRFVEALEVVLDPLTATLDGLHHYLDPDLAPGPWLELACAWLGIEYDELASTDEDEVRAHEERLRALVREAAWLGRRRGTLAAFERLLALRFPAVALRIEESFGRPASGDDPGEPPRVVVYCDDPIPPDLQARIARCLEQELPAHVAGKLRVKSKRSSSA